MFRRVQITYKNLSGTALFLISVGFATWWEVWYPKVS
jgi:hypothetical protein